MGRTWKEKRERKRKKEHSRQGNNIKTGKTILMSVRELDEEASLV